eukprot:6200790-Pleurochrysis_carterae.AAC.1
MAAGPVSAPFLEPPPRRWALRTAPAPAPAPDQWSLVSYTNTHFSARPGGNSSRQSSVKNQISMYTQFLACVVQSALKEHIT